MTHTSIQLLLQTPVPVAPAAILVLCVVAGIGTVLLLPSRREASIRKIGGAILLAAGLVFAALLVRWTAGSANGGMGAYFWIFSAIAIFGAIRVITHTKPVYSALYFVLTVLASAGLFLLAQAEFMAAALVLIYAGAILITYVFVIMLAAEAGGPGAKAALLEHDAVSRDPVVAAAIGLALMGVLLFVIFDKSQAIQQRGTGNPAIVSDSLQQHSNLDAASDLNAAILELSEAQDVAGGTFRSPTTRPSSRPGGAAAERTQLVSSSRNISFSYQSTDATMASKSVAELQGSTQQLGVYLFTNQLINLELAGLILTVAMVGAIVIARRKVWHETAEGRDLEEGGEVVLGPATPIDDDPHSIPVYGTTNPRQKAYPEA